MFIIVGKLIELMMLCQLLVMELEEEEMTTMK